MRIFNSNGKNKVQNSLRRKKSQSGQEQGWVVLRTWPDEGLWLREPWESLGHKDQGAPISATISTPHMGLKQNLQGATQSSDKEGVSHDHRDLEQVPEPLLASVPSSATSGRWYYSSWGCYEDSVSSQKYLEQCLARVPSCCW